MRMTAIIIIIAGYDSEGSCSQLIILFRNIRGPGLDSRIGREPEDRGCTLAAQPGRETISPASRMSQSGSHQIS